MDLLVHDLTLSINDNPRLQAINLEVPKGKILAVLGGAAAGKTLLVETIAGLRVPDKGEIFLQNQAIGRALPTNRNLGVVFERMNFFHHIDVLANLTLCVTHTQKKQSGDDRIHRTAENFRVSHLLSAMPHELNAWQSLQMQCVRALLHTPQALLLDSPFEQIPVGYHNTLRLLLGEQAANGLSIVFTTSNPRQAQLAGDIMLLLDQGVVLQKGTPSEFLSAPQSVFVANMLHDQGFSTLDGEIIKRLKTSVDCVFFDEYQTRLHVSTDKLHAYSAREIMLGIGANNIHLQEPTESHSFPVQARLVTTKHIGDKYVSLWRIKGNTVLESITAQPPPSLGTVEIWITTEGAILFDEHGKTLAVVQGVKARRHAKNVS